MSFYLLGLLHLWDRLLDFRDNNPHERGIPSLLRGPHHLGSILFLPQRIDAVSDPVQLPYILATPSLLLRFYVNNVGILTRYSDS